MTAKPESPTIDNSVRSIALGQPEAVAAVDESRLLTYGELDYRADQVASVLRSNFKLGVGSRVGVHMPHGIDTLVILLGVIRAGASYVPVDTALPITRVVSIFADSRPALVVTGDSSAAISGNTLSTRELMKLSDAVKVSEPVASAATPDADAYVIYTSGSTGAPKGVAVTHRNVLGLLDGTRRGLALTNSDVWAWFCSIGFDVAVWEIWGALTSGARLVILPHWTRLDPKALHASLFAESVTVLNQTPTAFASLIAADAGSSSRLGLRLVMFLGEALQPGILDDWVVRNPLHSTRLVNMYGITETTVHSTWREIDDLYIRSRSRSIGKALPGWRLSIVDSNRKALPPGEIGEIAVGGVGVARGYLNLPELTRARFITDAIGDRWYLSGDRGRELPDGEVEYLGRVDSQVKLRGHRIELDEVRSLLLNHPAVASGLVRLSERQPGDPATAQLEAFVTCQPAADIDGYALRDYLREALPEYMVPAVITILSEFPRTVNGKIDLTRLHESSAISRVSRENDHSYPDGPASDALRTAWTTVLGASPELSRSFLDQGGSSLLAVRLISELEHAGFTLELPALFGAPTWLDIHEHVRVTNSDGTQVHAS